MVALPLALIVAVVLLWPRVGSPGWTGAAIAVPSCPVDAQGCRISVSHWSDADESADASVIAQKYWSGAATTLDVLLPAGIYAVAAEGCEGYKIENAKISITSGYHVAIDLGASWELPGSIGRACPGFKTTP